MISGAGRVRIGEDTIEVKFTVPEAACTPQALLSDAQVLANQIAALGETRARRIGRTISCQAGCGACCRQLVPISPTEALHLAGVVAALPAERAGRIRERFEDALHQMEAAKLDQRPDPEADKAGYRALGLAYFRLGIPCPFLEDESCSIHPQRPLICREYQVTSPPAACADPGAGAVRRAPVPVSVWSAFSRGASADGALEWMPLIEALRYAEKHPVGGAGLPGPRRVELLLAHLQRSVETENKSSGPH